MWLPDKAIDRLRNVVAAPDLSATKYRVIEELGQGGMGIVFLALDSELERHVALKVINLPDPGDDVSSRLIREARILAKLEHPGIVPVHDVGTLPDGRVFYVMKLVRGRRLDEYRRKNSSPINLLRVFLKICDAVAFAHSQDVIHRDLKPANIMIGSFGEVLILDWGVAKWLNAGKESRAEGGRRSAPLPESANPESESPGDGHPGNTAQGTILGTPGFMAPEQASGDIEKVDQRADVYALGAILYFLLTGQDPGDKPQSREKAPTARASRDRESHLSQAITRLGLGSPHQAELDFTAAVPRSLRGICLQAMHDQAAKRYQKVADLVADVSRFLDGLPVLAYRERPYERLARVIAKYRTPLLLVLTYVIFRFIFLIFGR